MYNLRPTLLQHIFSMGTPLCFSQLALPCLVRFSFKTRVLQLVARKNFENNAAGRTQPGAGIHVRTGGQTRGARGAMKPASEQMLIL